MDLLDFLTLDTIDATVTHSVLPCFATACGLGFLEISEAGHLAGRKAWTLGTGTADDPVTCPACLTTFGDIEGLKREISREQGHQARAEG